MAVLPCGLQQQQPRCTTLLWVAFHLEFEKNFNSSKLQLEVELPDVHTTRRATPGVGPIAGIVRTIMSSGPLSPRVQARIMAFMADAPSTPSQQQPQQQRSSALAAAPPPTPPPPVPAPSTAHPSTQQPPQHHQQQQQGPPHPPSSRPPPVLSPPDLFILAGDSPSSPCFVVKDNLLGPELARAASSDARHLQTQGHLRPAAMGSGATKWHNDSYRGDSLLWVSGGIAGAPDGTWAGLERALRRLAGVGAELRASRLGTVLRLVGKTSVQLAYYPGDGRGYVKHLDTNGPAGGEAKSWRVLTAVYYLNPDWCERDGGCLRVHLGGGEAAGGGGGGGSDTFDVPPLLDRMVLFRGDRVEHEVLPTFGPRYALTMWFYGTPPPLPSTPQPPLPTPSPTLAITPQPEAAAADADGDTRSQLPPLPLSPSPDLTSPIFVSIVSYRDPETPHTIADLLATAAAPGRIRIGLVLQCDLDAASSDAQLLPHCSLPPAIRRSVSTLVVDAREAAGPAWARHLAASLWRGEPYVLQSDSHMRFRRGWDAYLLSTLRRCPRPSRALLTTYPAAYTLPNNVPTGPSAARGTLLVASAFGADGLPRQRARPLAHVPTPQGEGGGGGGEGEPEPLSSGLWAAGFNFGPAAALVREVKYDPGLRHVFFGEEASMAARLFTRGWRFFAPPQAVAYHLWTRDHRPSFRETRSPESERDQQLGMRRIRALLGMRQPPPPPPPPPATSDSAAGGGEGSGSGGDGDGTAAAEQEEEVDLGEYGLGAEHTLAEFEEAAGVSFKNGTLRPGAENGGHAPSTFSDMAVKERREVLSILQAFMASQGHSA